MFDGFQETTIDTGEAKIFVRHGGQGTPLLLLHGHPQTHVMWHAVVPHLAKHFSVVCADLRGYGDSSKPKTTSDHEPYSKRAMARDMVNVMARLGYDRFAVVGHDRGGRCAYRLALDHPGIVERLTVLDIVPTGEAFSRTDLAFAHGYWHWFFLAQAYPLPECMIAGDPDAFYMRNSRSEFAPEALAAYRRSYSRPETIHAMCEDYRAGFGFDTALDLEDKKAGRKIECPVQVLWSSIGYLERWYDVLSVWREWASDVQGSGVPFGHHFPEEAPQMTAEKLLEFLGKGRSACAANG